MQNVKRKIIFIMIVLFLLSQAQLFAASCGDVNNSGTADIVDALLIAQHYVGISLAEVDTSTGDVNADTIMDIVDALLVAQFYVGLIDSLGCEIPKSEIIWKGGPYTLDGSNESVDLPTEITYDLDDFTIACWVHLNSLGTWSRIFDFGENTDIYMMLTPASGNTGYPYFCLTKESNSGEQGINARSALTTDSWQHLAVVKKGSTGILYINGQEAGRNESMTLSPSDLGNITHNYIGRSQWSNDPYLNGYIDHFFIYNGALDESEIADLNSDVPAVITPSPTPEITPGPSAAPSRSFWSLDTRRSEMDPSAWYQFNASLAMEGNYCLVYVQNGRSVAQSTIQTLVNEFDTKIWRLVTSNFAFPTDVDSNGKVILLLLDIIDGYSPPTNTGYIAGYFFSIDLYSNSELRGMGYPSHVQSNEAELLYIDISPNNPTTNSFRSTVAHEFQHLVNMSQNVLIEGGNNAPVWINEGFSMAAEAIYQNVALLRSRESWYDSDPLYSGASGITQDRAKSISGGYPMAVWNPYPSNPYTVFNNYALSHLFFAWLRIHMDSDSFFKTILSSRDNSIQSVINVCSPVLGPDVNTYPKMLGRFWMANLLGGNGKKSGLESYNGLNSHNGPYFYNSANASVRLYASGSMMFRNSAINNWSPSGGDSQINYEMGNTATQTADYTAPFGTGNGNSEYLIVYNNESGGTRQRTSAVLPAIATRSMGPTSFTKVNGLPPTSIDDLLDPNDPGLKKGREPSDAVLEPPVN